MFMKIKRFLKDEDGASAVEYGLIVGLVAVAAVAVLLTMGTNLSTLFDTVATRRVSEAELRDVDPGLDSLRNINRPEDYQAALASVAGKV